MIRRGFQLFRLGRRGVKAPLWVTSRGHRCRYLSSEASVASGKNLLHYWVAKLEFDARFMHNEWITMYGLGIACDPATVRPKIVAGGVGDLRAGPGGSGIRGWS